VIFAMAAPGIRLLARSLEKGGCPRLQSLHLAVNNIGDEGAGALGRLWMSGALSGLQASQIPGGGSMTPILK
jgi:hypothetical protein